MLVPKLFTTLKTYSRPQLFNDLAAGVILIFLVLAFYRLFRGVNRNLAVLVVILGGLSAFGPLSMDMYLPGLPALTRDLGASASTGQLTLCRSVPASTVAPVCVTLTPPTISAFWAAASNSTSATSWQPG